MSNSAVFLTPTNRLWRHESIIFISSKSTCIRSHDTVRSFWEKKVWNQCRQRSETVAWSRRQSQWNNRQWTPSPSRPSGIWRNGCLSLQELVDKRWLQQGMGRSFALRRLDPTTCNLLQWAKMKYKATWNDALCFGGGEVGCLGMYLSIIWLFFYRFVNIPAMPHWG